jgi:hypothetical protein
MKSERETQADRIIQIDIKLTRGLFAALVIVLTLAILAVYLAIGGGRALAAGHAAPQVVSDNMRQYYLTELGFNGADADTSCATGYRMASFWEIADPSNLKYNNSLGWDGRADSGEGPSSSAAGWVHTGWDASVEVVTGRGNCDVWSSADNSHWGTMAMLVNDWAANDEDLGPWIFVPMMCDVGFRVWCVED